jgi:hydrogenase maturation protease
VGTDHSHSGFEGPSGNEPKKGDRHVRTLILGLGSSGYGDERLGLEVARGLHAMLKDPEVDIVETSAAGLALFELVAGYDKVVVVDGVHSGEGDVGELRKLGLAELEPVAHRVSGGGLECRVSVQVDAACPPAMPREISVYAIELESSTLGSVDPVAGIEEAVPRLVAQIAREEFGARTRDGDWS